MADLTNQINPTQIPGVTTPAVPVSPRLKALQTLASSLPGQTQQAATAAQSNQAVSIQQAAAQVPAQATQAQISQMGAQAGTQAGQGQLALAQQQVNTSGNIGKAQVAEQQRVGQSQIDSAKLGLSQRQLNNENRLAQVDQQAKADIIDARHRFAMDDLGRKFTSERQMSDYLLLQGAREADWQTFQNQVTMAHDRRQAMLNASLNVIEQGMINNDSILRNLQDNLSREDISRQEHDNAARLYQEKAAQSVALNRAALELKKSIVAHAAKVADNQAMYQGVGTVVGAVAGGILGGGTPVGVGVGGLIGASVGGGIGGLVGSQT